MSPLSRLAQKNRGIGMRGRALFTLLVIFLVGCSDPITWSEQCRSSDGMWTATAHTIEHSGFGTGGAETTVEIKRSSGSQSSERVLAFADDGRAIKLQMQWDGSSHLSVVYDADPQMLYYQVLKTSGVDISVRDISNDPRGRARPSARP